MHDSPIQYPESLREKLRRIHSEQAAEYSDPVLTSHNAILVTSFLTTLYITLDGRVLSLDNLEENAALEELTDSASIWVALTVAAKNLQLPELLQLLPTKPADGVICDHCGGNRWLEVGKDVSTGAPGSAVCPTCHGLGWTSEA